MFILTPDQQSCKGFAQDPDFLGRNWVTSRFWGSNLEQILDFWCHLINSCQKDVEVFCVALVTYKLTKIYENNDPSAKYVNLEKNLII